MIGAMELSFYNDLNKFSENIAVVDDNGCKLTYAQIEEFCKEISKLVPTRSLVFCYCENQAGSLCSYVACLYNSIVPFLVADGIDDELNRQLVDTYKPAYMFMPKASKNYHGDSQIVFEKYGYIVVKGADVNADIHKDLALLLTTSGSTGSPKLVKQSYTNIQSNAEAIAEYLELDIDERPITTLPMNYTYGLSVINSHMQVGATIYMTSKGFMQREFWRFFKDNEITSIAGVPYNYEMLKKLRFFKMDLPSLKNMTQAGGKLSPELHKEFAEYAKDTGKRFVVMYGQTEATARMAYLPAEKSLEKYGSMGIAIPGGRFELLDENDNVIESSEIVGELVYYGANVTMGYAECLEDLAAGDERGGKLVTGDMAKRDDDGYYYIVGRKKRFLKIFGNRVNLDECERMLKKEFVDSEIVCGGSDDNLKIYVVGEVEDKQLVQFISMKTGLHSSAFKVVTLDEIPKNEVGKVLYNKLA